MTVQREAPVIMGIPPAITAENARFWEAARSGRLVVEHCGSCGAHGFPPRGRCRQCGNRELGEAQITGPGTIYSFTVNHVAWYDGMEVPFALALVDFAEAPGVRVPARIEASSPDAVAIGREVAVGFTPGPGGFMVPCFRLVET